MNAAPFRRSLASITLLLPLALLAGCGTQDVLTAPGSGLESGSLETMGSRTVRQSSWYEVGRMKVNPGHDPFVMTGSRYTLSFAKGAVNRATTITMMERDANVVDVQFFPDNISFSAPVTLTIDYKGTVNDPYSPSYSMGSVKVGRYNDDGTWTLLAGTNDPVNRTYTVTLNGFSRYALGDGMVTSGTGEGRGLDRPARIID
jgi:hypothetical protein